ncbi:peptide deformylase [Paracoccus sp. S3-43]|uniref:peptide deformylase n=1 Tax=Paracoccus sp. S3-43 TaxID=3030011 RepID=UPI0023B0F132|nr:peptide deformylase [Paracoccus sp. S3-43]WEF23811.1 peptide deformylase [Paracoccus sp. S3-43]
MPETGPSIPQPFLPVAGGDGGGGGGRVLPIVLHPDPVLRKRCAPAGDLTHAETRQLVRDLLATMYAAGGRGLAAPQLGVLRRVFVMDAGWKDGAPVPLALLDPEILACSDAREAAVERCLSIPDQPVSVSRPLTVEIGWYDLDGAHHRRLLTGAEARIAQHEADHLDGRLILDVPE